MTPHPPAHAAPAAASATPAAPVEAQGGARGIRWRLATIPEPGGARYAVFVDGVLVTSGHRTGEEALAEAERRVHQAEHADDASETVQEPRAW